VYFKCWWKWLAIKKTNNFRNRTEYGRQQQQASQAKINARTATTASKPK
jgi:hypothetical protein